jgi:hypothetical protein
MDAEGNSMDIVGNRLHVDKSEWVLFYRLNWELNNCQFQEVILREFQESQ